VVRFAIELGPNDKVRGNSVPLVSPDGGTVYISGGEARTGGLFARRLDEAAAVALPGVRNAVRPFLSPDGAWLGFTDGTGRMWKVPTAGGAAVPITDSRWGGATWGRDGAIIFAPAYNGGLWKVSEAGGTATQLTKIDSTLQELGHWWPQLLPDGKHVLFSAYRTPIDKARVEVLSLETGKRTLVLEGGIMARYVPSGHLLYARNSTLMAIPFDPVTLRTSGTATPVLEGVAGNYTDGHAAYDVGADGTLVYLSDSLFGRTSVVVSVDRRGIERPLLPAPGRYESPRLSPDGTRLAYVYYVPETSGDLWIRDLVRGSTEKVSGNSGLDFSPAWTPDGRELLFDIERTYYDIFRRPADLSRPAAPFFVGAGSDKIMSQISPDGRLAVFSYSGPRGGELWTAALDGDTPPTAYLKSDAAQGHPMMSPNGRWIAYDGNESGALEVYIQSFPDPGVARRQVSSGGASEPIWTKGGRELVFRAGDSVMAVSVDPATGNAGTPTLLFSGPFEDEPSYSSSRSWDASPDGERFVMVKHPPELEPRRIQVVLNWLDELRTKVPTR